VVLELVDHPVVPQLVAFEIGHEGLVDDGEVAGEVALDEQVAVGRLDRLGAAGDVRDRGWTERGGWRSSNPQR